MLIGMRVLGIDPSTVKTGWAVVTDGVPDGIGLIKAPSRLKKQEEKVDYMADNVRGMVAFAQPDLVVIEECGPQRNAKTFRALVRVEATISREARKLHVPVLLVMVKAVREVAMGDGKMGKETVFAKLSSRYIQFEWLPLDKGGDDQSDALAMAIAGPQLAERK